MKYSSVALGIGAASVVAMGVLFAPDSIEPSAPLEDKFTPDAEAAWKSHFDEIKNEITKFDDHRWAGSYYYGDGLGVNASLTLAPTSGFAFIWRGCLGVYDRNFGAVIPTGRGSLRLDFTYDNSRKGFQGVAEELVPIAWGERHYLVPFDDVVGFCNAVNSQREPRRGMHGSYYLRQGDHEKPVDGVPGLPEPYQAYLLSEPIDAEVVSVEATRVEEGFCGWPFHTTKVRLNVGRSENVLPGMSFRVYEPSDILYLGPRARVLSVNETTCDALISQPATDKMTPTAPALGWRLTTGSLFSQFDSKN